MGGSEPMTWAQSLLANYTDGILVLHRGRIVYERYFGVLAADRPHIAFSLTKSFVGTLAASLIVEGALDEQATVAHYIPELTDSGFADATIRQLLDMTTGIDYSEIYTDEASPFWGFCHAIGFLPRPSDARAPDTCRDYLQATKKAYPHGERLAYKTPNTDALAWVLSRVSGKSISELFQERFWWKLGMENEAFFTVDSTGTEFAGAGLNLTLRDLARFGETMRCGGCWQGEQVVPAAVIEDIRRGGNRLLFEAAGYKTLPGATYRSMWWVLHNSHGAYMARGIHGQGLYIDPTAEMVVARFASHPLASNANLDPTSLPAYQAVAEFLMRQTR
jgi:CubicO group peptidase (beta-lactamase class C family)